MQQQSEADSLLSNIYGFNQQQNVFPLLPQLQNNNQSFTQAKCNEYQQENYYLKQENQYLKNQVNMMETILIFFTDQIQNKK